MQIEFLQSIANDRVSFRAGQVVTTGFIPKGWRQWLESGVIRILPEDVMETAIVPERSERAVLPHKPAAARRKKVSG